MKKGTPISTLKKGNEEESKSKDKKRSKLKKKNPIAFQVSSGLGILRSTKGERGVSFEDGKEQVRAAMAIFRKIGEEASDAPR